MILIDRPRNSKTHSRNSVRARPSISAGADSREAMKSCTSTRRSETRSEICGWSTTIIQAPSLNCLKSVSAACSRKYEIARKNSEQALSASVGPALALSRKKSISRRKITRSNKRSLLSVMSILTVVVTGRQTREMRWEHRNHAL